MPPEENIDLIDRVYALRAADEKSALRPLWAEHAEYRAIGQGPMLPSVPVGPQDAPSAVEQLMDLFQFHDFERLDAVAAGDRVAVRWKVSLSRKGKPDEKVETELCELWRLTEDGKLKELVQFADTALIARLLP